MVKIRKLPATRWKEYRELRLEALRMEPAAFGSSYEEEADLPPKTWKERMANVLFALSGDRPIGMVVYLFLDRLKTRHIANICGVYVTNAHRGKRIGERLIATALSEIGKNTRITKITLNVNPKQEAARRLYEKFGFAAIGTLTDDLLVDGEFHDELIMEKHL